MTSTPAGFEQERAVLRRNVGKPHRLQRIEEALQRFVKAAPLVGLEAELIGPEALDRLPEFDALFR